MEKNDKDNLCSSYDAFMIRQRCSILCVAYRYALEEMNSSRWVEDCCMKALVVCSELGLDAAATTAR